MLLIMEALALRSASVRRRRVAGGPDLGEESLDLVNVLSGLLLLFDHVLRLLRAAIPRQHTHTEDRDQHSLRLVLP
jgi:hypothetical protein